MIFLVMMAAMVPAGALLLLMQRPKAAVPAGETHAAVE